MFACVSERACALLSDYCRYQWSLKALMVFLSRLRPILITHYTSATMKGHMSCSSHHLVHHPRKAESFLRTLELFKVSTLTPRHSAAEVTQCQMAASHRKHPVLLTLLRLFSLVARGHMGSRARRPPTLELLNHSHAASYSYLQFNMSAA